MEGKQLGVTIRRLGLFLFRIEHTQLYLRFCTLQRVSHYVYRTKIDSPSLQSHTAYTAYTAWRMLLEFPTLFLRLSLLNFLEFCILYCQSAMMVLGYSTVTYLRSQITIGINTVILTIRLCT